MQNPVSHPTFGAVCTKAWATDLRNKLKEFLVANVPKNTSPQIVHWYASFKKKAGLHHAENSQFGGGLDQTSPEVEDLKEKLLLIQKHYVMLEKKEEYAKNTLIESQSKWTLFSRDILNISKELIATLEAYQIHQTINKVPLDPI